MSERPRMTKAAEHFPATLAACAQLAEPEGCDRIRFMRLRAKGGELARHADITDREAGTADGMIARFHIPIVTSPAVRFRAGMSAASALTRNGRKARSAISTSASRTPLTNSDPALARDRDRRNIERDNPLGAGLDAAAGACGMKADWPERAAVLERYAPNFIVVRDDLLSEGGSKLRFLPFLVGHASEVAFGGPFCGGAPLALAVLGAATGQKITLFYAARAKLHWRQQRAQALGAELRFVRPGYMSNVRPRRAPMRARPARCSCRSASTFPPPRSLSLRR